MINYGIYGTLPLPEVENNISSPYIPVRVLDIILNDKHPLWEKYGGWDALGLIIFTPFYGELNNNVFSSNIAKPLFSNVKNYPLIQELTYIISLPDPITSNDPKASSYYYLNNINIWNHPHHNGYPSDKALEFFKNKKLDYQEIQTGLNINDNNDTSFKFGKTFVENKDIKPLLPFEGDIIFEGRFGQSIRFGSTVKNENLWSSEGENGDPITIIRNGQPSNISKGWIPTLEDINLDQSSIYLTSNQKLPIELASTNLKSFEINNTNNTLIKNITLSDNIDSNIQINANSLSNNNIISSNNTLFSNIVEKKPIYKEEEIDNFPGEEDLNLKEEFDKENENKSLETTPEKYNSNILKNESNQTKLNSEEYILYQNGKIIGTTKIKYIKGIRVTTQYEPYIKILLEAAEKENIPLMLTSGFRTWDEQLNKRKNNLIDKSKINDEKYLLEAQSNLFNPFTARPGYSNHQNGRAIDLNTSNINVYKWLVKNAIKYGFIRTVPTERWHWEYLPNSKQFTYVAQNDLSWDKLV